jgi:Dockerin type I domain
VINNVVNDLQAVSGPTTMQNKSATIIVLLLLLQPAAGIGFFFEWIKNFLCAHFQWFFLLGWLLESCDPRRGGPFDVNGDGLTNEQDLVALVRSVSDPDGVQADPSVVADIDGDGVVNLTDFRLLVDEIIATVGQLALAGPDGLAFLNQAYIDALLNRDWYQFSNEAAFLGDDGARKVRLLGGQDQQFQDAVVPRHLQQCGLSVSGDFVKGAGSDPVRTWPSNYIYNDPTVTLVSAWDYPNRYLWGKYLERAEASGQVPDGTRGYRHFFENSGTDLPIDYERAIREDSEIRSGVDAYIDRVARSVIALFDGNEASFDFHAKRNRGVSSATANWYAALGWHAIWASGTAAYNQGNCQLEITMNLKIEDQYDFAKDLAPWNLDNGRLIRLGWARPFLSKAAFSRIKVVDLDCCQDEDCGDATEFDCICNLCTTQCPTSQRSGGQGFFRFTVELFKTRGTISVSYEMYSIPDRLNIYYEGTQIYTTGGLVSGSATLGVNYGSATSTTTFVTVEIDAPNLSTAWDVSVSCPP